ncbi:MAG: cold shock domain-containing protein [Lentisphaerae bacterium]|nr:cold shock domain-containing protein [Lentisphaerota bacterium]
MISKGIVKWFNTRKRFGFIECEDTRAEVFLHCSEVTGNQSLSVSVGDRVEFEIDDLRTIGPRARNVRKLETRAAFDGMELTRLAK